MSRTGWTTRPRGMALVEMQATLEADDRHAPDLAQQQPAGMARRRGRRPAREVGERDDHRRFEPPGQAAEPGAQDDAEARDQVGARTDGRLERVQAGRQVAGVEGVGHGRQDTPRRSRADGRGSREVTGDRGGFSGRRRYRHRDADRTPPTDPIARDPGGPPDHGQGSARSDRPVGHRLRVDSSAGLDVISAAAAPSRGRRG